MTGLKRSAIVFFSMTALASLSHLIAQTALSTSPIAASEPDAAYVQSFEKWKSNQIDDLKQNWLPLVGLFWLKPGANTFGSAPDNALVFPKGPAHAGQFDLAGKDVTLELTPEGQTAVAGNTQTNSKLVPDSSGHPSVVEMGSLRFHVIDRGDRMGVRLKDLESPALAKFKGLKFYPLDLNYRVRATWEPTDGKKTMEVPNVLGDVMHVYVPGTVAFEINGQEYKLTALGGNPSKGLSFVFGDLTSKNETYPGGRFLDSGPVENGSVILDFNRAYNPPCAVTPYATCPMAPKENRLAIAIPAGERFDKSAHAHH